MKKLFVILSIIAVFAFAGCSSRNVQTAQSPKTPDAAGQSVSEQEEEEAEKEADGKGQTLLADGDSSSGITSIEVSSQALIKQERNADESLGQEELLVQREPQTASQKSSSEVSSAPVLPAETDGDWKLLLVNYNHAIDENFAPELVEVQGQYKMDVRAAGAMKEMIAGAKAQGIDLLVCSAYRPYSSQKRNFDASVSQYMQAGYSEEEARTETLRLIAAPGTSEHQTGLAADIVTPAYQRLDDGYADTDAAKWLKANAADYGFILRYPSDKTNETKIDFEPWHYRYVGVDAAKKIMSQGLCLEEYLQ